MTSEAAPAGIIVEVRLSDEPLARRISAWIETSGAFVAGPAGETHSVLIADHIPDDAGGPIILLAGEDEPAAWPADSRVTARLSPETSLVKLRIAVEAAANGLSIREAPKKPRGAASEVPALTGRELEVLRHLAEGDSNKAIARTLGVSSHTVKFHVAAILGKLGASTRTEATTQAIRLGLLMV